MKELIRRPASQAKRQASSRLSHRVEMPELSPLVRTRNPAARFMVTGNGCVLMVTRVKSNGRQ